MIFCLIFYINFIFLSFIQKFLTLVISIVQLPPSGKRGPGATNAFCLRKRSRDPQIDLHYTRPAEIHFWRSSRVALDLHCSNSRDPQPDLHCTGMDRAGKSIQWKEKLEGEATLQLEN